MTEDSSKCHESKISRVLYDRTTTRRLLLLHLRIKLESAASMQLVHLPSCVYVEGLAVSCEIVGACRRTLILPHSSALCAVWCSGAPMLVCARAHACDCALSARLVSQLVRADKFKPIWHLLACLHC